MLTSMGLHTYTRGAVATGVSGPDRTLLKVKCFCLGLHGDHISIHSQKIMCSAGG